eukprot:g4804.t1
MLSRVCLLAALLSPGAALVQVEQFGMAQCPMTSLLTSDFFGRCFQNGHGIAEVVNYTLNMVGGAGGGLIDNTTDSKSFHGDQEIVAEKYFLCARQLEPELGIGTYQWLNFTNCMNGYGGIGICTLYLPNQIENKAQLCAAAHGFDWTTMDACAKGAEGDALFKASEYFTDSEMRKFKATNRTEGIPQYGTAGGDDWGIPIIRINGVVYKNTPGAYDLLGKHICDAAGKGPTTCGCKLV